ncbi:MAG: RagB/SusD family nutrient uptake outer membrane protein [Candidatus Azobacteroides sp.]|nr:RagB/SusD family nutrient uptake outer membrane protein [Candidatus Azobacteroides sp.]
MKSKLLKIFSVAILATTMVACDDYLDSSSDSDLTPDVVFTSPIRTEQALFRVFELMGTNNAYRNRIILATDWNTDIERYSNQNGSTLTADGGNDAAFSWYNVTSGSSRNILNDGFSFIYQCIEVTNLVITGIEEYGDLNNTEIQALYAEALTLRAMYYVDLCKWWGDVPARWEPVSDATMYIPATDRNEIYDKLLDDLLLAQEYVDWAGEGNGPAEVKRVNKAAVKAFRARIALYAAGYAQRPLSMTPAGNVLKRGSNAQVAKNVTPERERELYEIARQETGDIISRYGKTKLLSNYEDVFKAICGQRYNWSATESVWEICYRNQFVNQNTIKHENADRWNDRSGSTSSSVNIVPSFYYDFEDGDTRRDVSAVPYSWRSVNGSYEDDGGVYQVLNRSFHTMPMAKFRIEWLPYALTSANDTYAQLVMIRYADVLLMYAEACLQTNTNVADGLEKFNWIRERAFGNSNHNKTSLTMEDIMDERAFELAGERIRKYDLIRWGKLKEKMDEAIENVYELESQSGSYADVPLVVYTREVTGREYENSTVLEIWGLNRGEEGEPAGDGWEGPQSINVTSSSLGNQYYLYTVNPNVAAVNDYDPEFRSLYPFHNSVVSDNPNLVNNYGY